MLRPLRDFAVFLCAVLFGTALLGTANEILELGIWRDFEYPLLLDRGPADYPEFLSQFLFGTFVVGIVAVFLVQLVSSRESD